MKKPLYQRLIEKAQIEEERALREKVKSFIKHFFFAVNPTDSFFSPTFMSS